MPGSATIGISGGWGAYLTESAVRRQDIVELEQVTLTQLRDTKIGKASRQAVVTVAAVDGLSPFFAALVVVMPFFLVSLLPSVWYENGPMAALESLAAGIPLVGTDIGGIPEMIQDGVTGIIAPGKAPSDLLAALLRAAALEPDAELTPI